MNYSIMSADEILRLAIPVTPLEKKLCQIISDYEFDRNLHSMDLRIEELQEDVDEADERVFLATVNMQSDDVLIKGLIKRCEESGVNVEDLL